MYTKTFEHTLSAEVRREARLQAIAADSGYSPKVLDTDEETFIRMEHLHEMCVADKYGDSIRKTPKWIREQIVEILWNLYDTHGIQYVDVTPYNFVEKNKKVWIIDFGHARVDGDYLDPYLSKIFDTWKLSKWNPHFR